MASTLKTNKLIRIKRQNGTTMQVVREHYLREDVPCNSVMCFGTCQNSESIQKLPGDVTHYLVPDVDTVLQYLDILELPEFTGILLMQTVSQAVQHEGGRKHYRRLQNLLKNQLKSSALFFNEFQRYSYCPRQPQESAKNWQIRSVHEACTWYYDHLVEQMPLVMLTTNEQLAAEYGAKRMGVFVLTIPGYLKQFWPHQKEAFQLYESLKVSWEASLIKEKDFSGYLPSEVLDNGIKNGTLIVGNLQVSKHNASSEAFVRRNGASGKAVEHSEDILIWGGKDRNRTVHGETVVVELFPQIQWKCKSNALKEHSTENKPGDEEDETESGDVCPTGRVVGVLQRNWRDYVVSLAQEEVGNAERTGKVLAIPWDWRVPKIRISTRQVETLRNQRFIVRIDNWETDSQYPNGHFMRSLGQIGHLETEIAALLIENTISAGPFMEAVMKEMPVNTSDNPWVIEPQEVQRRRDLRDSHLIFSIDPKGCEDVDDTLSIKRLKNGNLQLGVHIADVTYFVRPNSACDLEARTRSTTVYLADRRYDMLPVILSSDLCSLVSGVDRYAVSVIWELDNNYEVKDVWYGRTVIRSRYKLFYEIAQEMEEGASDETLVKNIPELQNVKMEAQIDTLGELRDAVHMLMEVARHLRAKRTAHGALELEGVEVRVQLSETKSIQDLIPKQALEIHETIAECMIFANHWVAKKICQAFPNQALLRHHPLPRENHFRNLINCAKSQGFEIKTHSNKALAESLDNCVSPHDPEVNKILRTLATQAMSNAAYFSTGSLPRDQFFHYGLALDFYTHFTSPIRRYADVLVHRLLLAAVGTDVTDSLPGNKMLDELSAHINSRHRAAQHAQRDSQELFQALFFKDRPAYDEASIVNAIIYEIRSNGVMVFVPRYGIKGAAYLRSKDGQVAYVPKGDVAEWVGGTLTHTADSVTVHSIFGTQRYQLFDHITARVTVQELHAHASAIRLELLYNRMYLSKDQIFEAKAQKGAMIKKVQQQADEMSQEQNALVDLGEKFPELKRLYGQTEHSKSLYCLLQSFQKTAMMDY